MISRDPQHWAFMLDRVTRFDDSHETWMWRLAFARRLWG